MFKKLSILILVIVSLVAFNYWVKNANDQPISGAPPYGLAEEETPVVNPLAFLHEWQRPDVAPTVGVQVGHWKNDQVPEELEKLRNNTGASGGGKWEWEVNLEIANLIADNLRSKNVVVDILPTTVPSDYWADVFIAIHADGSENPYKSGYKFASPWRDFSGKSDKLADELNNSYGEKTGLVFDPNISRNMRGYYAFSWWRFEHSIHPMTTAVIAETGFLTNSGDRKIIVNNPEISANAISDVLISYLEENQLL